MRVNYSYRKLYILIFHAITCIICSSANRCLKDFRSSSGSFGSPVLATSVELVQVETELSSLKTDVTMTADRCSELIFWLLIIIIFAIVFSFIYSYNNYFITTYLYVSYVATYLTSYRL